MAAFLVKLLIFYVRGTRHSITEAKRVSYAKMKDWWSEVQEIIVFVLHTITVIFFSEFIGCSLRCNARQDRRYRFTFENRLWWHNAKGTWCRDQKITTQSCESSFITLYQEYTKKSELFSQIELLWGMLKMIKMLSQFCRFTWHWPMTSRNVRLGSLTAGFILKMGNKTYSYREF